jgi:hypothetical protein
LTANYSRRQPTKPVSKSFSAYAKPEPRSVLFSQYNKGFEGDNQTNLDSARPGLYRHGG